MRKIDEDAPLVDPMISPLICSHCTWRQRACDFTKGEDPKKPPTLHREDELENAMTVLLQLLPVFCPHAHALVKIYKDMNKAERAQKEFDYV